MTFTRSLRGSVGALILLVAAGCGETAPPATAPDRVEAALARGDAIAAEAALRDMVRAGTPDAARAAYSGEAALIRGDLAEARRWLGGGHFTPQTAARGLRMMGRLEVLSGDLPAAAAALDRALEIAPRDPELWVDIGRMRYRGGEQIQAIAAADRALALGPDNAAALWFRGQLVRDAQGAEAALPWFERGLKHDPANMALVADHAATLGELGRARDMLAAIRAAGDGNDGRLLYLQAVLAGRAGDYHLARRLLQSSDEEHRASPAGLLLAGVIDLGLGNPASAAQQFDRLLAIQPDNSRARMLLARALLLGGDERELLRRFAPEVQRAGASPYLLTLMGRAHEALGERDRAAAVLDRAARAAGRGATPGLAPIPPHRQPEPGQVPAEGERTVNSVRSLIAEEREDEAATQALAFHRRYPGAFDPAVLAGDAALAARKPQAALALYERAAKIRRPWSLTRRMISAYSATGQGRQAEALLARHLAGEPLNADAAALLAMFRKDRGDRAAAARLLDHAIALSGGSDPALRTARHALD